MKKHLIRANAADRAAFRNITGTCVGTGRMGLALQKEYQDQLEAVQALCGFAFIRGHGLFHDDMAIYQPWTDADGVRHERYCFTYLDRVMDAYRRIGIRPFLELGFMPAEMASGKQTIFYWHGNTTPPADEARWTALVKATLTHLAERYGREEVSSWPCEVWNEPNLAGFWENADKGKYLRLYDITSRAVKEALPEMRVGGPAICGGTGSQDWVRDFLAFCREHACPLDFVTRHAYMGQQPERKGDYLYHTMCAPEETLAEMQETRDIIDSFPEYRSLPLYITEFNTSYNPRCPIHDTNMNAAVMAGLLAVLGDAVDLASYWTFGDVFEEMGVQRTPFHGGFGLMADRLIPKPTLWTFSWFSRLTGACALRDGNTVLTRRPDGAWEGVAWNIGGEDLCLEADLEMDGPAVLLTETADGETCDPLKVWHDLGEPATLSDSDVEVLRRSAVPAVRTERADSADGRVRVAFPVRQNGVVHFTVRPALMQGDEGYDYTWYGKRGEA